MNKRSQISIASILCVILFMSLSYNESNGQNQSNKLSSGLKAIHRSDNSFVTYNDSLSIKVPIPLIVKNKIGGLLKNYESSSPPDYENLPPVAFKINYSKNIDIYIVKLYSFTAISYYLIAFNNVSNSITKTLPSINGKWMENKEAGFMKGDHLLTDPLFYFQDINHDGKKEIIIKERVHNGTAYNAVVNHIYSLDKQMNFNKIICIESRWIDPMNGPGINRSLHNNIITSELINNNKVTAIGKVKLTGAQKVISEKCYQPEYENLLITGSGVNDEVFLRNGYTFRY